MGLKKMPTLPGLIEGEDGIYDSLPPEESDVDGLLRDLRRGALGVVEEDDDELAWENAYNGKGDLMMELVFEKNALKVDSGKVSSVEYLIGQEGARIKVKYENREGDEVEAVYSATWDDLEEADIELN